MSLNTSRRSSRQRGHRSSIRQIRLERRSDTRIDSQKILLTGGVDAHRGPASSIMVSGAPSGGDEVGGDRLRLDRCLFRRQRALVEQYSNRGPIWNIHMHLNKKEMINFSLFSVSEFFILHSQTELTPSLFAASRMSTNTRYSRSDRGPFGSPPKATSQHQSAASW